MTRKLGSACYCIVVRFGPLVVDDHTAHPSKGKITQHIYESFFNSYHVIASYPPPNKPHSYDSNDKNSEPSSSSKKQNLHSEAFKNKYLNSRIYTHPCILYWFRFLMLVILVYMYGKYSKVLTLWNKRG